MSDLIATGLFTLGGAAIGAVGTQITGIITSISKSRRRHERMLQEQARAREARRRPLYTKLIDLIGDTMRQLTELKASYAENIWNSPKLIELRDAIAVNLSDIHSLSTQVRIDGSSQAQEIALRLSQAIIHLDRSLEERHQGPAQPVLSGAITSLNQAQAELITAARDEFSFLSSQWNLGRQICAVDRHLRGSLRRRCLADRQRSCGGRALAGLLR